MSQYWSKLVHSLTPYVPGEQPKSKNMIKLNTNENPYPPSPKSLQAIHEAANEGLRLYPDPNSDLLKQSIAHYYTLEAKQIFVGNGSDEVLAHIFQALLKHDAPLLFPDISYSFYPVYCGLYGIDYKNIPLNNNFEIDINDYNQANGGIIFPNPNAPTGIGLALESIEILLQQNPSSVVVIDEAYIDFGGVSAVPLINTYPNLLVVQTLSKSRSLAGLRVGFAMGHPDLIQALVRVKDSFNSYPLGKPATQGATAAINDKTYFLDICARIIATREKLTLQLEELGFEVLPSQANFVFAQHPKHRALTLAQALRDNHIIVRHFKAARIDNYLRITVGTDAESEQFIQSLTDIISSMA
ncbi:MAG: histidinol-phosphate transaminase [Ghiorsea sp.]|nr:histidinol-phosphate transaminase [Ghiorsea sp.]